MNAIQFIQQHGVDRARECIEEANAYGGFWVNAKTFELSKQIPSYNAVSVREIQRIVESVDYLNEWYEGKIDDAYDHVERMHGMLKLRPQFPNLHSRIQLVEGHLSNWERIYGGEHV